MNLFNRTGKNARLLGTALLLVTFVAGALAGAATERVTRADDTPAPQRGRPMRGGFNRLLQDDRFAQELQLTQEQRTQINEIIARRDAQAKKVWSEAEPRLKAVGEETRAEIQGLMTPEQVQKLEAEMAKRHAMWKERHKCHAPDSAKTTPKM